MNKPANNHLLALDGLRFFAAFTVLLAHYTAMVLNPQGVQNSFSLFLSTLSGIGMPLFFVLSGFVIHWNYNELLRKPNGIKKYIIARFSRLYPLYLTVLLIEFIICFKHNMGSASYAGSRWALFFALPYYLTLTQNWVFGIVGKNNLLYQYGMASSVSWSISLEFFFYLSYLFFVKYINKITKISTAISLILLLQALVFFYLITCDHFVSFIEKAALAGFGVYATMANGYQDSFFRWLNYFNPWVNLPAFIFGVITAKIYLIQQNKPISQMEQKCGGWLTSLSVLAVLFFYCCVYCIYSSAFNHFVSRVGSILYAPIMLLPIYCLIRYQDTWWNRIISCRLFVKLGMASYSIYLLHAFFAGYISNFDGLGLNPWLLYFLSITLILCISHLSYLFFERPTQSLLRHQLNKLIGSKHAEEERNLEIIYVTK